jgi:hypothetical protein
MKNMSVQTQLGRVILATMRFNQLIGRVNEGYQIPNDAFVAALEAMNFEKKQYQHYLLSLTRQQ